ncbi:hypothetical protein [Streptomyces telluris]|uniref:Uncharacterized protein n=1 Tax=Streptomyces telluris TaxID=2720021 RepID=A0A9X2LFY2_9ACTN|nr:hypothetical protein [Streptomyces telluris]MCQ8770582.1 hypothetical protein [Streptomyces telluris]NJP79352.1 hypothetical protein [Streptomyces telluris]
MPIAPGAAVSEFAEAMQQRVRQARKALEEAESAGDAYETAVAADELEDALRLARAHGVDTG